MDKLPPGSLGQRYAVLAVDPFSKYVEISALPTKSSSALAKWFLTDILARYGSPRAVRSDNGTEFHGEFSALLSMCHIT